MGNLLRTVAAFASLASVAYCALSIWATLRFARRLKQPIFESTNQPPVSILKSLKGTDPEMYEGLRSHCLQTYPDYEILFGISDPSDPAVAVVETLKHDYPDHNISVVLCDKILGANGKVSNLAQIAAAVRHDIFVVNDSDIRVEPDYLGTVMRELQQPNVGLVTCLYRGVPANTVASKLESLGISSDFMAGVLVARAREGGLRFGLGSTLALRRRDLDAIGGFEAIADYLADDYQLGKHIAAKNLKVELSHAVVETFLPAYDFRGFFSHQLRWARTIRASRPGGYAGLLLTFTLPWTLFALALAHGARWAWGLLLLGLVLRLVMALVTGTFVLRDKHLLPSLWLLPIRDLLAVAIWFAGLRGRKIVWRGQSFELDHEKLKHIE